VKHAFTLLELLTVIAMIAILAALLFPALARAKSKSHRTQCYNNQRQISLSLMMYADDNREFFPAYEDSATWGGKRGNGKYTLHGGMVWETNRPLDRYATTLDLYHCPADKGDAFYPYVTDPCFEAWGNSYLMTWGMDRYRVQHCGGDSQAARGSNDATPIKTSRIAIKPGTKLILSDWPWLGDRNINDPRSVWHNDRGKPIFPTLFGDSHVENFRFPPNRTIYDDGGPGLPNGDPVNFPALTWW
jgi:prepilin-type N-terminal cleavage/methylation domain-containing protein